MEETWIDVMQELGEIDERVNSLSFGECCNDSATSASEPRLVRKIEEAIVNLNTLLKERCLPLDKIQLTKDQTILEYFVDYGYEQNPSGMNASRQQTPRKRPQTPLTSINTTPLKQMHFNSQSVESPTLENLGFSSFTWNLIHGENSKTINNAKESLAHSEFSLSTPPKFTFNTDDALKSYVPQQASEFGLMMSSVSDSEYKRLDATITSSVSLNMLNNFVSDINDYITDLRFLNGDFELSLVPTEKLESFVSSNFSLFLLALTDLEKLVQVDEGFKIQFY